MSHTKDYKLGYLDQQVLLQVLFVERISDSLTYLFAFGVYSVSHTNITIDLQYHHYLTCISTKDTSLLKVVK